MSSSPLKLLWKKELLITLRITVVTIILTFIAGYFATKDNFPPVINSEVTKLDGQK